MEIKLENLKYKSLFKNLNLKINSGQIIGIIGKNGSGKSTLLNLIYGIDNKFEGKIYIDEKIINSKSKYGDVCICKQKISYLPQNYDKFLFNENFFETIKYNVKSNLSNELNSLFKTFNLNNDILNKNYLFLSSTELKKMMLIKTFAENKQIILLDDPTNNIEEKSIDNLVKILKREKRKGKIIFVSTTNSNFLIKISDRIVVLDGDETFEDNDKYKVLSNKSLLNKIHFKTPDTIEFKQIASKKNIKLVYRDNINDLIKDIYRNVR